ncbi:MAG TPA: glycerol-3-phosphate dehydrogenase, partial [Pseudomonas sp.]|nr:glycerol-3-phosphate dehydrogenase [Pseudomonas sp.]
KDILHSFAGVRPLCDDESDNPSAVTRDYTLSLSAEEKQAPLLSVFGGKLTTYRKLAESAMAQLKPYFPRMGESWTASVPLPGGEGMSTAEALAAELMAEIRGIDRPLAKRWATLYGNRVWRMLGDARSLDALGENFGQHLYAQEVDYLRREEWATQVEDILWRRSKLGLAFTADELTRLQQHLQTQVNRTTDVDAA